VLFERGRPPGERDGTHQHIVRGAPLPAAFVSRPECAFSASAALERRATGLQQERFGTLTLSLVAALAFRAGLAVARRPREREWTDTVVAPPDRHVAQRRRRGLAEEQPVVS